MTTRAAELLGIWRPQRLGGFPRSTRERIQRTEEWGWSTAAHFLPDRLKYWVLIDVGARYLGGPDHPDEEIPAVPFTVVLQRSSPDIQRIAEKLSRL